MQNSKQIGHILFNKIFLGYVLIAIIFTSYHIYVQYSLAKDTVLKDMKTIEKAFYNGIANSVWHLDEKQINSNAQAIESIQGIVGISIISANNEVLSQKGNLSLEDKKYTSFLYAKNKNISFSNGLIKHSFQVTHEDFSPGEILAHVDIYTSENAIYSIVKDSLIFILIYTLIIVVVLWVLFNHFSKKLLTNPLHQIIQATKDLNIKEYTEITLNHNDKNRSELDILVDTFNTMSQRITESFSKLKEQKQDLIEANKYQTDFLANMSHELKTPLNSINIISSVMSKNSKNDLNDKQVKNMQVINKSGNHLLSLINDILDISKLEAGELSVFFEKLSLENILDEVYESMTPLAKNKSISLSKNINLQNNIVISDMKKIKQVIQNLLSNAIKFTNEGEVQFNVSEDDVNIIVDIVDSGIGIQKDKLENIFDRFKQVDGSITRTYGGTGLGLAISKELAGFLGGNLTVNSEIKKGSSFQFTFPKNSNMTLKQIQLQNNTNPAINKPEKTEVEVILETDGTIEKEDKIKVLLLNSDPVTFFSLIVAIKKQIQLDCLALKSVPEVIKELELNQTSILIVDSDTLDIKLQEYIKNSVSVKVIGLSTTQETSKYIDTIVSKPVDVNNLLAVLLKKEKNHE